MLIYLEALEALYAASGYQIAGGLFWHIRNNQHSGLLNLQTNAEIRKRGLEQISSHVNKIRSGEFMEKPTKIDGGKCSNYCEFYRICRLPIINQYKKDS